MIGWCSKRIMFLIGLTTIHVWMVLTSVHVLMILKHIHVLLALTTIDV